MTHKREQGEVALHFGERLWSLCIPFVAGMAFGLAVLVALRTAKLRWTWALLGAPLAYVAWLIDWQVGLFLTTATLTTAGGGFYWNLQATERGGEEARQARAARGRFTSLAPGRHGGETGISG